MPASRRSRSLRFWDLRQAVDGRIDSTAHQEISMLRILLAACYTALDVFRAADNPLDEQLVADLARMTERTRAELERLESQASGREG